MPRGLLATVSKSKGLQSQTGHVEGAVATRSQSHPEGGGQRMLSAMRSMPPSRRPWGQAGAPARGQAWAHLSSQERLLWAGAQRVRRECTTPSTLTCSLRVLVLCASGPPTLL